MDLCDIWTNISETVHAMTNVSMKDIYEVRSPNNGKVGIKSSARTPGASGLILM